MTSPPPLTQAIEAVQVLGPTEYEVACFPTLVRFSSGTANDGSDGGAVPRSGGYDLVDRATVTTATIDEGRLPGGDVESTIWGRGRQTDWLPC